LLTKYTPLPQFISCSQKNHNLLLMKSLSNPHKFHHSYASLETETNRPRGNPSNSQGVVGDKLGRKEQSTCGSPKWQRQSNATKANPLFSLVSLSLVSLTCHSFVHHKELIDFTQWVAHLAEGLLGDVPGQAVNGDLGIRAAATRVDPPTSSSPPRPWASPHWPPCPPRLHRCLPRPGRPPSRRRPGRGGSTIVVVPLQLL